MAAARLAVCFIALAVVRLPPQVSAMRSLAGGRHRVGHRSQAGRNKTQRRASRDDLARFPEDAVALRPPDFEHPVSGKAVLGTAGGQANLTKQPLGRRIQEASPRLPDKGMSDLKRWFDAYVKSHPPEDGHPPEAWQQLWIFLSRLGGGIGAAVGGMGVLALDLELAERMKAQDEVSLVILVTMYFTMLASWGMLEHKRARNHAAAAFYADPRFHDATAEDYDLEGFLEAFNRAPGNARLRVTGYQPTYADAPGSVGWQGTAYRVEFSFSLDLEPWLTPKQGDHEVPRNPSECVLARGDQEVASVAIGRDGVQIEEKQRLERWLATNQNELGYVCVEKHVEWDNWEELAVNIKQQVKQRGFSGFVSVDRADREEMHVYRNTQWSNFLHSRVLKVIIALSLVGWLVYGPYMLIRCQELRVNTYFRVNIKVAEYWGLVAEHLTPYGFESTPAADQPMFHPPLPPINSEESESSMDHHLLDDGGGYVSWT